MCVEPGLITANSSRAFCSGQVEVILALHRESCNNNVCSRLGVRGKLTDALARLLLTLTPQTRLMTTEYCETFMGYLPYDLSAGIFRTVLSA